MAYYYHMSRMIFIENIYKVGLQSAYTRTGEKAVQAGGSCDMAGNRGRIISYIGSMMNKIAQECHSDMTTLPNQYILPPELSHITSTKEIAMRIQSETARLMRTTMHDLTDDSRPAVEHAHHLIIDNLLMLFININRERTGWTVNQPTNNRWNPVKALFKTRWNNMKNTLFESPNHPLTVLATIAATQHNAAENIISSQHIYWWGEQSLASLKQNLLNYQAWDNPPCSRLLFRVDPAEAEKRAGINFKTDMAQGNAKMHTETMPPYLLEWTTIPALGTPERTAWTTENTEWSFLTG